MKKAIKVIGVCSLAIVVLVGLYIAISSSFGVLDFRGSVVKIEVADNQTTIYISSFESTYAVVANEKTKVVYCCEDDPEIALADIKVGDSIEGNYRAFSKKKVAKFITVQYHQ